MAVSAEPRTIRVAVAGNPNSGKTTIFNALTGLRLKVGNYPGVTVERREGRLRDDPSGATLLIDMPGTYSLAARSLDECVARDVLLGWLPGEPSPDAVLVVLDASNLERNCYLASQILELNLPTVLVCNMMDGAARRGCRIDLAALGKAFGVPVVGTVGNRGQGIRRIAPALRRALAREVQPRSCCPLPPDVQGPIEGLAAALIGHGVAGPRNARAAALFLLLHPERHPDFQDPEEPLPPAIERAVAGTRAALAAAGHEDIAALLVQNRYAWISQLLDGVVRHPERPAESLSDRIDHVLAHKVFGMFWFALIMFGVFAGIFWLAEPAMGLVERLVGLAQRQVRALLGDGVLTDLLADGVVAGVGNVVVFFPQICLLFLFIAILEDTGYMARAAFLMDRIMRRVGLHGKSFIPLLSSLGCAVPGIMATRTIESRRDRLATILVAPLMVCSARLPVYVVLIALIWPREQVWAKAAVLGGLYLFGILAALGVAAVLKNTLLWGPTPMFVMELPPYRLPAPVPVVRVVWDRCQAFLARAGTFILAASILLWALFYWPRPPQTPAGPARAVAAAPGQARADQSSSRQLEYSLAGRFGKLIEPVVSPLGYDWRIGVGVLASFAAREVFVSTMGIVYSVEQTDGNEGNLRRQMQAAARPDGTPVFSRATCLSLLLFYALAMQCVSTLAVTWRETGSWRWPALQWGYMAALAYGASWVTYHAAAALGWAS